MEPTYTPLIEQLAVAALGLGNKVAWSIIHNGMMQLPGLTIEQRNYLKACAWEELKRLRREQRASRAPALTAEHAGD